MWKKGESERSNLKGMVVGDYTADVCIRIGRIMQEMEFFEGDTSAVQHTGTRALAVTPGLA